MELVDKNKVSAPLPCVCPLCVHCSPLEPGDASLPLNDTAVELSILGSGDSTSHYSRKVSRPVLASFSVV